MKFLVVDDSLAMRRIIINALHRIGYTDVVAVADGHEALGCFDETIDFVITDWHMPKMSGVELTRAIRSAAGGESVPIMLVTTRGAREDIVAAIDAGVNGYVLKPVIPSALREKIDRIVAMISVTA